MTILETSQTDDPRVVLDGVSWETYERLLEDVGDGHTRLTYDDGRLEIISPPSGNREYIKKSLARIIETYAFEMKISVAGYGSTTLTSRGQLKGLEPDECFYIQRAQEMARQRYIVLTIHPPPDLAIEINTTPRSVAREPIFAAFRVPELWSYDGIAITSRHLAAGGSYIAATRSLALPNFPMEVVNRILQMALSAGQPASLEALQKWVRSGKLP